nr:hypothetical protein CE91St29_04090 [Corynebacterium striatum]
MVPLAVLGAKNAAKWFLYPLNGPDQRDHLERSAGLERVPQRRIAPRCRYAAANQAPRARDDVAVLVRD